MKSPLIIDSCILIELQRQGYTFEDETDIEFWKYLIELAKNNYLKFPESVIQELEKGHDKLASWVKRNRDILKLSTSTVLYKEEYINVIKAYEEQLPNGFTEDDVEWIGSRADPYVIAHALKESGTIVTSEIEKGPATTIQKIKIPTICRKMSVPYISLSKFIWHIAQKKLLDKKE